MAVGFLEQFVRVSADMPCPICEKDSWCVVSADGGTVLCQRVESPRRRGEAGWAHSIDPIEVADPEAAPKLDPEIVDALCSKWQDALTAERCAWLARKLSLSEASLKALGVGWRQDRYTFPMVDANLTPIGVRFRYPSGVKRSLTGSRDGLFVPQPFSFTARPYRLFITEGPTDCAAIWDQGFLAVGRPSCTGGTRHILDLLERRPSSPVIVCDNDEPDARGRRPGLEGAKSLTAAIAEADRFGEKPVIIGPVRDKDARSCITNGGGHAMLEQAANGVSNKYWRVIRC